MKYLFALILYVLAIANLNAKEPELASHMAVYDLKLERVTDEAGMTGLTGRMVYEFKGSICEGYTTRFRLITKVEAEDVAPRLSDHQVNSFESADAKEFRFTGKTIIDDQVNEEVDGVAKVENNNLLINLKKPTEEKHELVVAQFPTFQTQEVIKQALAGKHFYRTTLYDGVQDSDKIIDATVVIGKKKTASIDSETKVMGALGQQSYWPVTISYFDDEESNDGLPTYRTSFLLYENGVTRDLLMDYGNFSIRGKLKKIQLFNAPADVKDCKN